MGEGDKKQYFPKINTHDLRDFLDNGGQIKDLINRQVFLKIFKEIQNTIKMEEEKQLQASKKRAANNLAYPWKQQPSKE